MIVLNYYKKNNRKDTQNPPLMLGFTFKDSQVIQNLDCKNIKNYNLKPNRVFYP